MSGVQEQRKTRGRGEPSKCARGRGGGGRRVATLIRSVSLFFSHREHPSEARMKGGQEPRSAPPATSKHELKSKLHFNKQELEALSLIYSKLMGAYSGQGSPADSPKHQRREGLERGMFRDLLHSTFGIRTEDILMDRIFSVFDAGSDGLVKEDEWLNGMSVFLKGTLQEKTAFAFSVYDLNSDGFVGKEEMFTLLRNSLVKQPQDEDPEEGVKDLVELVLKKLDVDKDGKVSSEDFRKAVQQEPLFLEAFGQCLPSEPAASAFLLTLSVSQP